MKTWPEKGLFLAVERENFFQFQEAPPQDEQCNLRWELTVDNF